MENHIITEEEMRRVCTWRYEGKYRIYDLPSYEIMQKLRMGFFKPGARENYRAFCMDGEVIGFTNIQEENKEVFIGIGVRPDKCGQGLGRQILQEAYRISKSRWPEKPLYLHVRTWNQRAVNCYKKAGFRIDGKPFTLETGIGEGRFYRMVRE